MQKDVVLPAGARKAILPLIWQISLPNSDFFFIIPKSYKTSLFLGTCFHTVICSKQLFAILSTCIKHLGFKSIFKYLKLKIISNVKALQCKNAFIQKELQALKRHLENKGGMRRAAKATSY